MDSVKSVVVILGILSLVVAGCDDSGGAGGGSGSTTEDAPATTTSVTTTAPLTTMGSSSSDASTTTEDSGDSSSTGLTDPTNTTGSSSGGSSSSGGDSSSTGGSDEDIQCEGPDGDAACEMPSAYMGSGECDPYAQDCPDAERCVPWADDGSGTWNSTRCSAVSEMPDQLGDACTAVGVGTTGVDSCDVGLMCFGLDGDADTRCVELCGCGPEQPTCTGGGTVCSISNQGALPLCLATCDPLLPADESPCPPSFGCYFTGGDFQCVPDSSGTVGQYGDTCEAINACDSGLRCVGQESQNQPDCGGDFCCTPTCDVDEDTCPDGMECFPMFDESTAPEPCHEDTGFCRLPE